MVASSETLPSSTSWAIASLVKSLLMDPRLKRVSARFGVRCSREASPYAERNITESPFVTSTAPEKASARDSESR